MPCSRARFLRHIVLIPGLAIALFHATNSFGAAKSYPQIRQIRAAAERGHIPDEIALGDAYLTGHGVAQDEKMAAFWYEKAAGAGDAMAQNQIGYFYQVGLGVPTDEKRAVHWFQLAAAAGFIDAKVNLGVAFMWGAGAPKNPVLAAQLIKEAADKGSAIGATYLGDMYRYGVETAKDDSAAEQWYERGAKLHNSLAAFRLGGILCEPKDHPRDIRRAVKLYREAASAGFVPAMHSLGLLLVNHPELSSSHDADAVSLLNRSADAGTWRSSVVLGILSRDGRLVPKDETAAYFHFQIAIQQGGDNARTLLSNDMKILNARLDAKQQTRIDKEVQSWMANHKVALVVIYNSRDHLIRFPAFGLKATPPGVHAAALIATDPFEDLPSS